MIKRLGLILAALMLFSVEAKAQQQVQALIVDTTGPDVAGTFTNATQTTSVTANTENGLIGYSTITVTISGTYATASAQFEKTDDDTLTNWFPVQCAQEGAGIIETGYSALSNTSRMWQCNTQGANAFRVRSTAVSTGTVNVLISPSGAPTSNGSTISTASSAPISNANFPMISAALSATGTTPVTAFAAPATGRIYITGFQVSNSSSISSLAALVAGPNNIILWQGLNPASGGNNPPLNTPIAASTGLSIGCLFSVAATTQFCDLQGYTGN